MNQVIRIVLLFLSFLCLSGCQEQEVSIYKNEVSERNKLSNEVTFKTAMKLKKEKGLIPCGFGGGSVDCIRMLAISFDYRLPLSIEEGRKLLIEAVHEFVDAINSNEQIRPYLVSYPFGIECVEIRIFVQDDKGNSIASTEADVFCCTKGICEYEVMNKERTGLNTVFKETFAEAELRAKLIKN